jgi:hypothetical protein
VARFGGANRAETQPISFVTGKEAPSLLITPWRDALVSPENSRRMAEKIHSHGGVAEERIFRGVGHLTLIGTFAPALRVLAPVLREVTQFIWRVTRQTDLATHRDVAIDVDWLRKFRAAPLLPKLEPRHANGGVHGRFCACVSTG